MNMTTMEYWKWLNQFIDLLEYHTNSVGESPNPRILAELRLAERTLNSFIDQFMHYVDKAEGEPVGIGNFLQKQHGGRDVWNGLKNRRDAVADKISGLIESNPAFLERYTQYCEHAKNLRAIGAML